MELDQADMKRLSMSQPELDTSGTFDIPSPPPVATNQSEPYFTIPNQSQLSVTINTQPESKEPLTNSTDISNVHRETPKAPIAAIPELQLDDERVNLPVRDNSFKNDATLPAPTIHTESISVVDTQTTPSLPASQPPIMLDTSDHKASVVESVSACDSPRDNDIFQQSYTKTEITRTESTSVTLAHHQPDAPDMADSTTPSGEPFLTSVDSKTDTRIIKSTPVPRDDNDNTALSKVSACAERSIPEPAKSVTKTLAVSSDKSTHPYSQDAVYGALYESLFPQSFTSEIMSSLSNPPPQIRTEIRHLSPKSEPVMVKTLNELHTETNVIHSRLSSDFAARRMDDAGSSDTNMNANFTVVSSNESSRFTSYQSSATTDLQTDTDTRHSYHPSSLSSAAQQADKDIPYSELTCTDSEMKSDSFSCIHDTVRSVPMIQNSTPSIPDCVTSQGTDTQVTDSKRRVILVKELVTDEGSADSGCPSPVPDKMSAKAKNLELNIETTESFYTASAGSGQTDGPLSPAYLSVGSDDGSAMEIYYSAEEDNAEESEEEEMYTVDEREEVCVVDGMKEVEWGEIAEREGSKKDERDFRVVIVKMHSEEGNMGSEEKKEDLHRQTEVQQQLTGQGEEARVHETEKAEFFVSNDAKSQDKEVATTALPQVKEEEEEGRKEELLATPVQQVNTLMVCKVTPPSGEPHGQGEGSKGNWNEDFETEDHLNGAKKLPSHEIQYLAHKDSRSSEYIHAASSNTREEDAITPTFGEAEEQVSLTADKREGVSKESLETNSKATTSVVTGTSAGAEVVTGVLTQTTELQSGATEIEHNRAPQSSEWVDPITHSTDRNRTVQEQVAVELSALNAGTHHPDTEPAEALSETQEHPAEAQPDLIKG